jgi:hypothetical protein
LYFYGQKKSGKTFAKKAESYISFKAGSFKFDGNILSANCLLIKPRFTPTGLLDSVSATFFGLKRGAKTSPLQ